MQAKDPIEYDDLRLLPDLSDTGAAQTLRSRKEEREPDFQEALREARREAFSRAIARLQQAGSAAVATLLRIVCDGKTPGATRVRAAVTTRDGLPESPGLLAV
jgi:hypothetical protein